MASIRKDILTSARPADVWDVIRDVGAVHTRLAPGFVTNTQLEPGMRIVTFANGMVAREPILAIDEETRRVAWTAESGLTTHYNSSMQVFAEGETAFFWRGEISTDQGASWRTNVEFRARRTGPT
ncbi:MAG: SRPBCC family protein [Rhodomicrobiaceae bacterium]